MSDERLPQGWTGEAKVWRTGVSDLREAIKHFLVASSLTRSDQPNTPYVKIMGPSVDDVEVVLAAARKFLALTETGQRVAWCQNHDLQAIDAECEAYLSGASPLHCSPVPVYVIPADYLTEETK